MLRGCPSPRGRPDPSVSGMEMSVLHVKTTTDILTSKSTWPPGREGASPGVGEGEKEGGGRAAPSRLPPPPAEGGEGRGAAAGVVPAPRARGSPPRLAPGAVGAEVAPSVPPRRRHPSARPSGVAGRSRGAGVNWEGKTFLVLFLLAMH